MKKYFMIYKKRCLHIGIGLFIFLATVGSFLLVFGLNGFGISLVTWLICWEISAYRTWVDKKYSKEEKADMRR